MAQAKDKEQIMKILQEALDKDPSTFYKVPALARLGYFEWCFKFVETHREEFLEKIKQITRSKSYKRDRPKKDENTRTNRGEEWFVLDLFRNTDKNEIFGDLYGYQIPIKNSNEDKGAGKIDFISVLNDRLYLHEIKADYSPESILKAILEIQTYYQQVDHEKLKKDFDLPTNMKVKKSVVIFENSKAYEQVIKPESQELVKNLLKWFDIELFVLSNSNVFTRKRINGL